MGLYLRGLIIRGIFASEIWGAYFREGLFFFGGGGAYYRNFTVGHFFEYKPSDHTQNTELRYM